MRIGFPQVAWVLLGAGLAGSPYSRAGDPALNEAWMKKEQSVLQYKKAIRALGKSTPADRDRLKREILDPAQKQYQDSRTGYIKAQNEKWKNAFQKSVPRNLEYYKKKFAAMFRGKPDDTKGKAAATAPTGPGEKAKIDRAERKNVTVEGEQIIEEMEFGAGEPKTEGDEAEMVFTGKKMKRAERKNVVVDPKDSEDMEFGGKAPAKP